jgi:hypothetical protein
LPTGFFGEIEDQAQFMFDPTSQHVLVIWISSPLSCAVEGFKPRPESGPPDPSAMAIAPWLMYIAGPGFVALCYAHKLGKRLS